MAVINLMKDVVVNTLDEVLKKEKNTNLSAGNKDDILAYILNRVPPKYVTSERGLLHGVLDARYKIQDRVDILFLIYEAIHRITTRRESISHMNEPVSMGAPAILPHIVGQVLEESSFSIIPDIEVTLVFGSGPAEMVDSDWENPYGTTAATKGHYHFWPRYDENVMAKSAQVPFAIRFSHPQFVEKSININLEVIAKPDFGQSKFIPIVLLKSRDAGADQGPFQ